MPPRALFTFAAQWKTVWAATRGLVRRRELALVVLASAIGIVGGGAVTLISQAAYALQQFFYRLPAGTRLSGSVQLESPWLALVPAGGGLALGLLILLGRRIRPKTAIDPIEANALHGGRMSFVDSVIVAVQTIVSNGCGASVGLEAAYTQINAALASRLGQQFRLRRGDMRIMVGAGAAAGISAAFDAPLTGSFYAFELIIGTYAIASAAPVMAAALAASLTVRALGGAAIPLHVPLSSPGHLTDYLLFAALGVVCGLCGIAVMRSVGIVEAVFHRSRIPDALRPMIGGLMVGALALITPQILSSGHAALHEEFTPVVSLGAVGGLILMKALASIVSLGAGFRGGLFFASLFLGALVGKLFAGVVLIVAPHAALEPSGAALIGMSALGVAVVGGPLTMTFLVLEMTGDFVITGAVLTSAIIAGLTVRELFGYSFSTWRFHLRGETIRSAHDVGWLRSLTVEKLMKRGVATVPQHAALDDLRATFPLGSTERLVAVDSAGRYSGLLYLPDAFSPDLAEGGTVDALLRHRADVLRPGMTAKEAIAVFDSTEAEALAVVAADGSCIGLLTEHHAVRRYADELDKAQMETFAG
jgi:CIC family chloride channel protein